MNPADPAMARTWREWTDAKDAARRRREERGMSEWIGRDRHRRPFDHESEDHIRPLVVVNNVIQLVPCALYNEASTVPASHTALLNDHHICPDSWWVHAGKDPNLSPMISLCPNCHYNVHVAIDARIKGQDTSLLPLKCRNLADQAFTIAAANGLTPALTL